MAIGLAFRFPLAVFRTLSALCGGILLSHAAIVSANQRPTIFVATFESDNPSEEQIADRRDSLATVTLRPQVVAELEDGVDEAILDELDIPDEGLAEPGSYVFGSSDRPSLLCSTLIVSISSKANACFRDFDRNGDFEQIVKSSVDQLHSDIIVPDDEGTQSAA
ncbi:hypothetical protein [uncultured Erythrobacter sp.]|uniref:hypothetical protein n=1 Tax=uncultured Erythrobacter sp. TaxID=263913 RepID=UPI00260ADF8A|nr:hypothetical protein [uncultured Erythrobacter sp.]